MSNTLIEEKHKTNSSQQYDFLDLQSPELKNPFISWVAAITIESSDKGMKKEIPTRNAFPVELSKISVLNTRALPPGPHKSL